MQDYCSFTECYTLIVSMAPERQSLEPTQVCRIKFLFRENFQPPDIYLLEFLTRITVQSSLVDFPIYSRLLRARGADTLGSPSLKGGPLMNSDLTGSHRRRIFWKKRRLLPSESEIAAAVLPHHKPVTGVDSLPRTRMAARTASRLDGL